jgi:iron complex outermembrane receptor protein
LAVNIYIRFQIGLLWNTSKHQQWYVNLSQAQEIPGISDLTSAGVLPFDPSDTQNSTKFEIGTRGQYQQWAWDVSVYRSEVEDEFIDFTEGFVTFTVNSESDTIHQGIEAGLDWEPTISNLNKRGIDAIWGHVLTVNDFQFDNHPLYGNNTLAGVPEINYLTEVSLSHATWKASFNVRYVNDGKFRACASGTNFY